ncbi:MAG TPA: hypothetical protein PLK31_26875, partial [Chloroflexota bacterium]|nr:hypothetical protein [Chloroflexota bacterium]
ASDYVAAIMTLLEKRSLNGAEEPVLVYLTCYQVLVALGDERAAAVLQAGHDFLQQRAFYLQDDAQRQQFLDGVAAHRELETAYAAMAAR